MKTLSLVLRVLSGALVALVALVFTVLEGTLLVTLDFALYENQAVALIQLVLKLLIALIALAIGVLSLVKRSRSFFFEGICLLLGSAVMIPFVSNHFGLCFTAVSAFFMLSHWLCRKYGAKNI